MTVSRTNGCYRAIIRRPAPAHCHTVARLFTCTALTPARPLYPPKQTFIAWIGMSALGGDFNRSTQHLLILPDEEVWLWRGMHGHGSRRSRESALPPKADIRRRQLDVRFGPNGDKAQRSKSVAFDHLVCSRNQNQIVLFID